MNLFSCLLISMILSIISSVITAKIIAAYYFEIIDDFLKKHDNDVMDLISWAKGVNKHQ